MAAKTTKMESRLMGTMPEAKLLMTMAVPMMLSMLVQALYNIVDSIYVARVSEDCLAALSLAFPAQTMMISLGTGTGVGVSALVSRALGAGDGKQARRIAGNALFLCLCCWGVMVLFGLFGAVPFIRSQTELSSIRYHGESYLRIVTIGSLFLYFEICVERLLQSTGQTRLSMWTQMVGAVTNIILDPFFIFGWAGLPAMGTAGAAVATIIGQGTGAALGFFFHLRFNKELSLRLADCRPRGHIIGGIYKIAFPSILMMSIGSITNYLMNRILHSFTSTAVACYGAYFKIQSFFFMPIFGMNSALIPILGYNYGASKRDRIHRTIRYGVFFAAAIMTLGLIAFQLLPEKLLSIFSASETMLKIGVPGMRIISIHFPVAAFCIIAGSACQALGNSMASFINSIMRQVVVLIPAAYLLSLTGNVNNVWWCFPIAEIMSALVSAFFLQRTLGSVDRQIEARTAA